MSPKGKKKKCMICGKITDEYNFFEDSVLCEWKSMSPNLVSTYTCYECEKRISEEKFRRLNDFSKNKERD